MAWAEAYLRTKWHLNPSNRLATITNVTDRQDRTDRQLSDRIGRTVLQTVAQKCDSAIYTRLVDIRSAADKWLRENRVYFAVRYIGIVILRATVCYLRELCAKTFERICMKF